MTVVRLSLFRRAGRIVSPSPPQPPYPSTTNKMSQALPSKDHTGWSQIQHSLITQSLVLLVWVALVVVIFSILIYWQKCSMHPSQLKQWVFNAQFQLSPSKTSWILVRENQSPVHGPSSQATPSTFDSCIQRGGGSCDAGCVSNNNIPSEKQSSSCLLCTQQQRLVTFMHCVFSLWNTWSARD